MVIQEGGAVQVHSNELNVHRKFLFRKWRQGDSAGTRMKGLLAGYNRPEAGRAPAGGQ